MTKNKFKDWSIQILILLTILFIFTKISFLLKPIGVFISTLFFPLLISGFLFFIFNPVVKFFQKKLKLSRVISILVLYLLIFSLIGVAIATVFPIINKQITSFVSDLPTYGKQLEEFILKTSKSEDFKNLIANDYVPLETLQEKSMAFLNTLPDKITNGAMSVFGFITNATITIVTVPILLFYMFKDGHKFPAAFSKFFPSEYRQQGLETMEDVGGTLSAYISGQVMVASVVGILSLIGYLIIDVPYALVMALIVAITNIIPYVGPFLGGAPAVIIALFDSPLQAGLVILVILIAQQIEGNFLSPLILGKTLDIHPATVIILLLAAGNIAGVIGMVLAVPTYAVVKTIVLSIVRFRSARKKSSLET